MNKTILAILFAAIMSLQVVFAGVSSYTDPYTLTADQGGVARESTATTSVIRPTSTSSWTRKIGYPATPPCNVEITSDPRDKYFLGFAKSECATKNKGNQYCIQKCFDKIKLMIYTGAWDRQLGNYGRYNCQAADPEVVKSAKTATQCYYTASAECSKANPNQDYCRRKCTENAYALCRQGIATMRFSSSI